MAKSKFTKEEQEAIESMSDQEYNYLVAFDKFTKWMEGKGELSDEESKGAVKVFTEKFNYPASSPITMMYTAFYAGMQSGLKLAETVKAG